MANQMKVLVPLTASQGASISNGFNVASGAATIAGVQIATVTDVTGALVPYATLAGVSASFTTPAQVTSALAPYALSADVSSSFLAKSGGTITGNLVVNGTASVSGPFLFSSSIEAGPVLSTGSLNDLTSSLYTISQALGNMGPSAQSIQNSYDAIRFSNVNSFASNNRIKYFLAFETDIGQGTAATQDIAGDVFVTGSAIQGVSGSTEAACLTAIGSLSIDVQTKDSGSVFWTNDLVSVQAAAQQSGSFWYPLITIDAPGLGEGNGANQVRLIVVNEATHAFVIPS